MSSSEPEQLGPDLSRDVVLDARTLRGIAHPLRVRMLGLLRRDGPSTATKLAERAGVSSAAASYHLRSLAAYGFVIEADGPPDKHGRERYWRAVHRGTWLREELEPEDEDTAAAVDEYLRAVARSYAQRVDAWLDGSAAMPRAWQRVGTISDLTLRLTVEQARELGQRIGALLADYPRHEAGQDGPAGSERVAVQWQVLPELGNQ